MQVQQVMHMEHLPTSPLIAAQIKTIPCKDSILSVYAYITWPLGKCNLSLYQWYVCIAYARTFPERLSPSLRHSFEAASECGASCWLTTLPIAEHGFAMPKGEFHDALHLRFGRQPARLPLSYLCVAHLLMLNIHSVVLAAAFQQFVIMKYVTSLLISLVRFVPMLVLMSLLFDFLIVNLCSMQQLIGKMVLDSM